ncbi:hypothetical protein D3C74_308460 [compost metagenome]
MVLIFFTQRNRKVSVGVFEFTSGFQSIFGFAVFPVYRGQPEYTTAGDFRFILIFFLDKRILIEQSIMVQLVQPAEIFSFDGSFIVKLRFIRFGIHVIFAVVHPIRGIIRLVGHGDQHFPAIGIQGERNRGLTLRRWMFGYIFSKHLFIIVNRSDFRVPELL